MSDGDSLKQQTVRGTIWSAIERFSVQGIQFIILIVMARVLTPSDYGIVGMLTIFLAISQSLIDSGFSNALIQKIDRTETDYATVFYFNIAVGGILYGIMYFSASGIADFYDIPELISVTRIISLLLLINSLSIVHRAIFTIRIDFKTQAKASLIAVVISGIVGISMAYSGYGVWSIVAQTLVNQGLCTILLWFFSQWVPKWTFSYNSFKQLFSFGSKLMIVGILDTLYRNIYTIVIGKKYSAADLGFYTRAEQFAQFPTSNFTGIMQRVTFPVLSQLQNEEERLPIAYIKILRMSAFLIFPLGVGLACMARPLILTLLNETWTPSIRLLQILCFACIWYPIHALNLNLLQVKGRTDLSLIISVAQKIVAAGVLVRRIPMGLIPLCIGQIITTILLLIVNTYFTGKLIRVGLFLQLKAIFPYLFYAGIMGACVSFLLQIPVSNPKQLIIGTLGGIVSYIGIALVCKAPEVKELYSIINSHVEKIF